MNIDALDSDEKIIKDFVENVFLSNLKYDDYKRTPKIPGRHAASKCVRLNVFNLSDDYNEGLTGYNVIAAESGKAVENLLRANILKSGIGELVLWDENLPKVRAMGLNYSAVADFVFDIPKVGLVVVDLKTTQRINKEQRFNLDALEEAMAKGLTDTDLYKHVKKSKGSPRQTSLTMDAYLEQVIGYATFLDVDYGLVFALSRSKEKWSEPVTFTQELVEVTDQMKYMVIARMLMAQRCSDTKMMPPKPKEYKEYKQCKYCKFKEYCWTDMPYDYTDIDRDDAIEYYKDIWPEAVALYDKYRGSLVYIRNKKIEEAAELKTLIQNPTQENINKHLNKFQISLEDLLLNLSPMYEMKKWKQFGTKINIFDRDTSGTQVIQLSDNIKLLR